MRRREMFLPHCVSDTEVESELVLTSSFTPNNLIESFAGDMMGHMHSTLYVIPEEFETDDSTQVDSFESFESSFDSDDWPLPREGLPPPKSWSSSPATTLIDSDSSRVSSPSSLPPSSPILLASSHVIAPSMAPEKGLSKIIPCAYKGTRTSTTTRAVTDLAILTRYTHTVDLDQDASILAKVKSLVAELDANSSIVYLDSQCHVVPTYTWEDFDQKIFLPVLSAPNTPGTEYPVILPFGTHPVLNRLYAPWKTFFQERARARADYGFFMVDDRQSHWTQVQERQVWIGVNLGEPAGLQTSFGFVTVLREAVETGDFLISDTTPNHQESGRVFWTQLRGYFPYPEMELLVEAARRHIEWLDGLIEAGIMVIVGECDCAY